MDLERELRAIELAWPETPELRLELDARRRRSLRRLLVAVALLLVALAAAFAVPQSRGAILRFLHLGGVTIELVERLPAAQERPLGAGLGRVVTEVHAKRGPVLLSELGASDVGIVKKAIGVSTAIGGSTSIDSFELEGGPAFFISGSEHVLLFPGAAPRLAGNVLLWQAHGLTLRLEGRGLTRARAVELAGLLRSS
jgi:hypothetical protein